MRKRNATGLRVTVWAERKQDVMIIFAFGVWATILGLAPVILFRALG
ncbi:MULTISPECIES: hypothetical protein [Rhodopseudomonas]|nr:MULTISPECIES: hypothetical protein [Rhodopseudomonas]MDF3809641.1 hypothetical protein [Rhodopseudomonas sp. BAL398]WOK17284.1 hypothetical protein RBJ75_24710 [Rhodopseudomonas sp. BAL398]